MTKRYRLVYQDVLKAVGGDAAYLLAEITAWSEFCHKKGFLNMDGWFMFSETLIEEATGFNRQKQFREIKKLQDHGLILVRNENGVGREFKMPADVKKLSFDPPENGRVTRPKMIQVPAQKRTGTRPNLIHDPPENDTGLYIKNSKVNSTVISCSEENNKNTFDLIRDYFISKGQENEASKFIKYNRENFGEDHLTPANYKKLADKWIKAKKNPPKKKRQSGRSKTAREVAESQGLTVDELFKNSGQPKEPETKPENIDPLITELFGG